MSDSRQDEPTFEELLRQFDDAVSSLESSDLSLADALDRYESAVLLAEQCARLLSQAELRVREIDEKLDALDTDRDSPDG